MSGWSVSLGKCGVQIFQRWSIVGAGLWIVMNTGSRRIPPNLDDIADIEVVLPEKVASTMNHPEHAGGFA